MTAQGMLDAIIQAMDERISTHGMLEAITQAMDERIAPVIDRLEDLEERIRHPGGLPAGYEEALSKSIDARLAPVLERLGRVEDQLRLTVPAPEDRYVPTARTFAEDDGPDGGGYGDGDSGGSLDGYDGYDGYEDEAVPGEGEDEGFSYSEEEQEQDARDLERLLDRLEEMEERLLAQEDAAEAMLAMPRR